MTKENWYDKSPDDDVDFSDMSQRDAHYRHLVRAGIYVCECGHIHPADLQKYEEPGEISRVYATCWMNCGCTEYRPTKYLAKEFTSSELGTMYLTPKKQPSVKFWKK